MSHPQDIIIYIYIYGVRGFELAIMTLHCAMISYKRENHVHAKMTICFIIASLYVSKRGHCMYITETFYLYLAKRHICVHNIFTNEQMKLKTFTCRKKEK